MRKKQIYPWFSVLVLVASCNVQSEPIVEINSTDDAVAQISPTMTNEISPDVMSSPLPSPTKSSIQFPLPDLVLGLSSSYIPLNECRDRPSEGQVWVSQYPYETFTKILGDEQSDYYFPRWSPSGEWIAYVSVTPNKFEDTFANPTRREYFDSDSLWIIRPDGSDSRLVAGPFSRREVHSASGCDYSGGVVTFAGWSSDSQWLSYYYQGIWDDSGLYVVNIETGEILFLAERGVNTKWSNEGSRLSFYIQNSRWDDEAQQTIYDYELVVINMEQFPDNGLSFLVPDEILLDHLILSVLWPEDDNHLIVIVREGYYSDRIISLWKIDLIEGKWEEIAELGYSIPINSQVSSNHLFFCAFSTDGTRRIEVWDLLEGNLLTKYERLSADGCESLEKLRDFAGVELVSILRYGNRVEVSEFINIGKDYHQFSLHVGGPVSVPSGLDIYFYSWRP